MKFKPTRTNRMKFKNALKIAVPVFFMLLIVGAFSFTPKDTDPVEKLVAALQKWTETQPQEKVYLHTDKPYYMVGDTIWFKTYVTIGSKHQLSALSGAVYVDLYNEGDSLAQSLKLPLIAGMTKGSFVLPDSSSRDGNYRIRAYTQWMRNSDPAFFYDKIISVGNSVANTVFCKISYEYSKDGSKDVVTAVLTYSNDKGEALSNRHVDYALIENGYEKVFSGNKETDNYGQLKIKLQGGKSGKLQDKHLTAKLQTREKEIVVKDFSIKSISTQTDVQFFPESGPLVSGVRTRVAFKATGTDGLGVPIKGVIIDNDSKEVETFETTHLGMGQFRLLPEKGKSYQAKVTYPDGSEKSVKLPAVQESGYVLSVFNNTEIDTVLVRIVANPAIVEKGGQTVSLIAQASGSVSYASSMPINKAQTSLSIPAKDLPSGITQFTLFSSTGDPMNERVIFIQNKDQMDVKLSTAKKVYAGKEKVEIDLNVADGSGAPVGGNFSVSVVSEDAVPVDETKESTIFSQILLSSDIKGYIEKPSYYFNNPTEETKANLDLLMLTQGYRRFVWKDITAVKPFQPAFQAEKLTTNVTGRLLSLGEKPIAGGKVSLINNKLGVIIDTVTNAQGYYKFSDLLITNEISFTVQGRNAKGGKNVEIKVDKIRDQDRTPNFNVGDLDTDMGKSMLASLENSKKQDAELVKSGQMGRSQQLKEVVISAKKRKRQFGYDLILDGHADFTYRPNNVQAFGTLLEWLRATVTNVQFIQSEADCGPVTMPFSRNEKMKVFVDGREINECEVQDLFYLDPLDVERVDVARTNAAIMSMTGGPSLFLSTKRGVGVLRSGYNPEVVSYSPRGFNPVKEFYAPVYDSNSRITDLRSTVYWNPGVLVGANGKGKISFFNADTKGVYRVVIEGINGDGLLGRQVYKYEVK
jgi:hypothetical protein